MSYFLHINTALEVAYVAISENDIIINEYRSGLQKEHAGFLHPSISNLLKRLSLTIEQISAVSVIIGPGSYTGLRVGLSAAKGICYASGIPLITINTTEWMVASVLQLNAERFYPVIDARRNEIFTAIYDKNGVELTPPFAHILNDGSFIDTIEKFPTLFFGSGAGKCQSVIKHQNAAFLLETTAQSDEQAKIGMKKFAAKHFDDLAYSEPLYVKDFYTTAVKAGK
jgi:tRNA threonylcarbamoyladenosine biosynthesis protein TsaB